MSNWDWDKFTQTTKNRQPIAYLMEAVKILGLSNGRVLDLGCGAGVDAKYLAENGFKVEAVDLNERSVEEIKKLCSGLSVSVIQKNVADYDIVSNTYQLIIAWNILSFLTKNESRKILLDIQEGLTKDGIFVFSLFGLEDDWAKNHPEMSFWTKDELKNLLPKINFIKLSEEKQKRPGAMGQVKFWHLIQGIAQRS